MPLRSKLSQGSSTPIRRNTLRGERQSYHLWWLLRDLRPLFSEVRREQQVAENARTGYMRKRSEAAYDERRSSGNGRTGVDEECTTQV